MSVPIIVLCHGRYFRGFFRSGVTNNPNWEGCSESYSGEGPGKPLRSAQTLGPTSKSKLNTPPTSQCPHSPPSVSGRAEPTNRYHAEPRGSEEPHGGPCALVRGPLPGTPPKYTCLCILACVCARALAWKIVENGSARATSLNPGAAGPIPTGPVRLGAWALARNTPRDRVEHR